MAGSRPRCQSACEVLLQGHVAVAASSAFYVATAKTITGRESLHHFPFKSASTLCGLAIQKGQEMLFGAAGSTHEDRESREFAAEDPIDTCLDELFHCRSAAELERAPPYITAVFKDSSRASQETERPYVTHICNTQDGKRKLHSATSQTTA